LEISCPGCQRNIPYEDEPPKFCHQCGHSLSDPTNHSTQNDADVTIAPSVPAALPDESTLGDLFGPYRLVRWLGAGGMGVVWEAVDTATGRRVALKRLSRAVAADENQVQRFLREGQLAAQISNPKVTFIYTAGEYDGQPYIAMELMPGETLADRVKKCGSLPVAQAVDGMLDVIEGLEAAHKLGLIHRDVKPSNCFMDADESVKIGDFGLSKSLVTTEANLTQTGTFLGTPSYAAPEQIRAGELDERTDIYAVGATLFNLLTGRTPFEGDAMSVTAQIITDDAPAVRELNAKVPQDLSQVIAKCLEKDPAKRFSDLGQLKAALLPFGSGRQSLATVGRRMAGYMIDMVMLQLISVVSLGSIGAIIGMQSAIARQTTDDIQRQIAPISFWGGTIVWGVIILYFGVAEGCFGRSIGKRLMGLRVVDGEGQRPGILRGLLRAFILPGYLGFGPAYMAFLKPAIGATSQVLIGLQSTLVNLVPLGICASTMRVRNQFRGLHGFISGTRVTRLETGEKQLPVPVVMPKNQPIEPRTFGSFETNQVMGKSAGGEVLLGRDVPLNRNVWIVVSDNEAAPSLARINLTRMARQRWLEGGQLPRQRRWDAFEAIEGVPIQTFVGIDQQADWQDYRQIMLDVAIELREALDDQTLPPKLSLPQVWIHRNGHAKLLDRELVNLVPQDQPSPDAEANHEVSRDAEAFGLLKELGSLLSRTHVFPMSAQHFLAALADRESSRDSIEWAIKQLESLKKDMGSLAWDSRMGILGVTIGTEFPLYNLIASFAFLSCFYQLPIPNQWKLVVGLAISLIVPGILGYLFAGGPIFRFMGIRVCDRKGRPARKLTCFFRSVLSWWPLLGVTGAFLTLMIVGEISMNGGRTEPGSYAEYIKDNDLYVLGTLFLTFIFPLLIAAGALFGLWKPKRGLVDRLLGTQLMPE
jgi:uncharacterized RDD family membrane protein YckC